MAARTASTPLEVPIATVFQTGCRRTDVFDRRRRWRRHPEVRPEKLRLALNSGTSPRHNPNPVDNTGRPPPEWHREYAEL